MVDPKRLVLEKYQHENGEYGQGHGLLDNLQLPQIERSSILNESDPVGRHLTAIFKQGDSPAEKDDQG